MRFVILFTSLYLTSFIDLTAQEKNNTPNLIIGAQAGASVSRAIPRRNDFMFKQYSTIRPVFGLYADIGAAHLFSLRTGISYLLLGNRTLYLDGTWRTNLNYFAVPLLAKYKAHGGEIAVFAGPQISFLTNATIKDPQEDWKDIKEDCGKSDISATMGVSIEPKNSPVNVAIAYNIGFKKVYTEMTGEDLYNRGVAVTIQYKLIQR